MGGVSLACRGRVRCKLNAEIFEIGSRQNVLRRKSSVWSVLLRASLRELELQQERQRYYYYY